MAQILGQTLLLLADEPVFVYHALLLSSWQISSHRGKWLASRVPKKTKNRLANSVPNGIEEEGEEEDEKNQNNFSLLAERIF